MIEIKNDNLYVIKETDKTRIRLKLSKIDIHDIYTYQKYRYDFEEIENYINDELDKNSKDFFFSLSEDAKMIFIDEVIDEKNRLLDKNISLNETIKNSFTNILERYKM